MQCDGMGWDAMGWDGMSWNGMMSRHDVRCMSGRRAVDDQHADDMHGVGC